MLKILPGLAALAISTANAQCLSSAEDVWRDHPHAHATWRYVDGERCWHVGWPQRSYPHTYAIVEIAIPRPRPDAAMRIPPKQGRALAHELLDPPVSNFAERWP